jgi:hypothetical protein
MQYHFSSLQNTPPPTEDTPPLADEEIWMLLQMKRERFHFNRVIDSASLNRVPIA